MTVKDLRTLVDNLEEYIHVPGGIDRLKKTILHLAVSGQLVPQDPSEGTGEKLYQQIQVEKQKLIAEGKLKKQKPLPEITEDEIPFEIPRSWKWVRLENIANIITDGTHHTPKYQEAGVRFLSIKDVSSGSINLSNTKFISEQEHEEINKRCNPERGDILFCRIGTLGKPVVVDIDEKFSIFVSLGLIKFDHELLLSEYLRLYLDSPQTNKQYLEIMAGGSHTNKLNLVSMKSLKTALPPVREQERIIEKVKSIFSLVDELANRQKAEQEERVRLVKSSFSKLAKEQNHLALDMLTDIIKTREDIAELRKTILHLAVSGQLVPQDPSEGTGEKLYQQIQVEKQKLIAEGKLKKQKPLPEITEDEIPFEIPRSWKWVRLGVICKKIGSGSTPRGGKSAYKKEGPVFLRSQNVWNCGLNLRDVARISEETNEKMANTAVQANDVLLNITGASIGRTSVVPSSLGKANVSQHVTIVRPVIDDLSDMIHQIFMSGYFQNAIYSTQVGVSREGLSKQSLEKLLVPLAPLSEQGRISKKTRELLSLVAKLEKLLEN